LELSFFTKSLRKICESEAAAKEALGVRVAEKLKRRLADMRAAASVEELVAGRPHEVEGGWQPRFAVELGDGSRIVFSANHNTIPLLTSGGVDWARVTRIKILGIE
jgi:toxin HigB-1